MDHAVLPGCELDERPHLGEDAHDVADEHIADFGLVHDGFDDRLRALCGLGIAVGSDAHGTVVLDVDLGARLCDDGVDDLALLADDVADLFGVDLEGDDAGRVLTKFGRDLGHAFEHLGEDELPALVCLLDRGVHDLFGDALDLDVHLDGGDAVDGTRDLEVHIAEEVFKALDVGKDAEFARCLVLDEAHRNARDGSLDGHACVHQRHRGAADGRHRGRTVGREDVVDDTDGVRELLFGRDDGDERTLCKRAVTDLAAAGASERLGFARAVAGEVILVHVALARLVVEAFELLRLREHREGAGRERLRLTSREDGGAVHAGQDVAFAPDGTDVFEPSAVGADALIKDLGTDLLLIEIVEAVLDLAGVFGVDVGEVFERLLLDLGLARLALLAVEGIDGPLHLVGSERAHGGVQFLGDVVKFDGQLCLADGGDDLVFDEGADLLDLVVTDHDGTHHLVVGDLVRARLDHEDGVLRACEVEVDGALFALRRVGVDDVFAVNEADDHRTRGARPGDIGDGERDGRADHGKRLGRDVGLDGERGGDDHHVVEEALGEEGTKGTVDEARRQNGFVARPALATLEAARDLADRKHLLFIVHLKGEEIDALSGGRRHADGDHDRRLAAADDAHAVGLFGILARLDGDFSAAHREFELVIIHNDNSLILFGSCALRPPDRTAAPPPFPRKR